MTFFGAVLKEIARPRLSLRDMPERGNASWTR